MASRIRGFVASSAGGCGCCDKCGVVVLKGGTKLKGADVLSLNEAIEITKYLPFSEYLLPLGSVASKQPFPQDLDFLTTIDLSEVAAAFEKANPEVWRKTRLGKKRFDYYPILPNGKKLVINIWKGDEKDLGAKYFAYGYPKGFVIAMRKRAKNMGYKLNSEGIYKNGKKLDVSTLHEFFDILNLPFRTPEEEYLKHQKK